MTTKRINVNDNLSQIYETKTNKPTLTSAITPKYNIPQIQQQQQLTSTSFNNFKKISNNNFIPPSKNHQSNIQESDQSNSFLESSIFDCDCCQTKNLQDFGTDDMLNQSQQSLIQENIQLKAKLIKEYRNSQQLQFDLSEIEYLHNRLKLLINQLNERISNLEEQNSFLENENKLLNADLKMVGFIIILCDGKNF